MKRTFTVEGDPAGKGRPRFDSRSGRVYTPQKTVNYENYVRLCYENQCKEEGYDYEGPLILTIETYYGIPASTSKKRRELMLKGIIRPTKKPDMDNVIKIIADALNGIAYRDDKQIIKTTIEKLYAMQPYTVVTLEDFKAQIQEEA